MEIEVGTKYISLGLLKPSLFMTGIAPLVPVPFNIIPPFRPKIIGYKKSFYKLLRSSEYEHNIERHFNMNDLFALVINASS